MQQFKIQHSKDTFCDYLLVHTWHDFLDLVGMGIAKKDSSDLISLSQMDNFASFLSNDNENPYKMLKPFGIDDNEDLQKQLKQSIKNLKNQDLI